MNEFKKMGIKENSVVNKRRAFLKKASAGAIITSLPAKSVWGVCSVSGVMSGNMSTHGDVHECELPPLAPGRSPGFWKELEGLHGAFNQLENKNDPKRPCYHQQITWFINNNSMNLAPELITMGEDHLAVALSNEGGLIFQLAAVYLNAYYGFYGPEYTEDKDAASDLVNQILLYFHVQYQSGNPNPISEFYWQFSPKEDPDPTTNYKILACH